MTTGSMYKSLLSAQWKHQRTELVLMTIIGATAAPTSLWQALSSLSVAEPQALLTTAAFIGVFGSLLAVTVGMLLAVRPFLLDAQSKHAYALSLPIPRSEYALMRVATGLTLALIPTAGFLIGALVAVQALPSGMMLRAYPFSLSVRFMLATTLAFAVGFGIRYGLGQRAARWIVITALTIGAFEIFGQLALHTSLTTPFWQLLLSRFSPVRIFVDRWMLFDV